MNSTFEITLDPDNGERRMKLANPPAAVTISRDRHAMKSSFDAFNDANPETPIDHPEWMGTQPRSEWPIGWPALAKRRWGSGARGQVRLDSPADLRAFRRYRDYRLYGPFWAKYVVEEWRPSPREYRVHLVSGTKIVGVDWKQPRDPETEDPDAPKTSALYRFVALEIRNLATSEIRKQARRAMKATGLKQGAVDIGHDPVTGRTWVYETNARPGVERPDLIAAYVAAGAPQPTN